ncbi:MAG: 2'-5' RNA ligase [Paraglaciecola sp.]|jgi:2'-5' RNA ligase
MRAFFGLSPDAKTKLAIQNWCNKAFPHFNAPVPAANYHVTLAFLGNISGKQLETVNCLIDAMPSVPAFDVSLNQLGYWPKPRAFWLGSQQTESGHLMLAKNIHQIANMAGLQLQYRDYITHLTLARKCNVSPPAPIFSGHFRWHADQFHLFESKPGPQGVYYPIRQSWPLSKIETSF